jgi:hypothetical protein
MKRPTKLEWLAVAALAGVLAGPASAADDLSKDLTSTIALLGLPCGKVVSSTRQGSNDYIATCSDKNRYHVTLSPQGRVVAKKL